MLQTWNGKQREGRLYPERFSRSREKITVSFFVISNPFVDGCLWNIAHRWKLVVSAAKAGEQESHKFLLLLNWENIGGFFYLQERTHVETVFQSFEFVESDWEQFGRNVSVTQIKSNSASRCGIFPREGASIPQGGPRRRWRGRPCLRYGRGSPWIRWWWL